MDKHGFKLIFIIIMVINLVCASTVSYTNANFIGYLLLYGIIMACEGAMLSCFPAEAGKIFGSKVNQNFLIKYKYTIYFTKIIIVWTHYIWRFIFWCRTIKFFCLLINEIHRTIYLIRRIVLDYV